MRRRGWAATWALGNAIAAATATADGPEPAQPSEQAPVPLPAVSAPPELLQWLPPGARLPGTISEWTPAAQAAVAAESGRLTERIAREGDARGWIEVEYTIDRQIDARVREVLASAGVRLAEVVLMDPSSGALLAYVATDPAVFPVTRAYPTASLAKVVTAAAVLQHARKAAGRNCRYLGSPYVLGRAELEAPLEGGSVDSFRSALAFSNNQCFARLAVHDVGAEAMVGEMERVGLLEPPAPGHPAGRFEPIQDELDLGRLGSGLAGSSISPLGAVRLAALLARGELVRPRWIARARDEGGRPLALPPLEAPRRVWPPELASELRELLVGVTSQGTARRAFLDARGKPLLGPVRVSGKTGSLSGHDPEGRYQWFIGVAPAEEPRIAVAALTVNGGIGHAASRIAAQVLQQIFCEAGRCVPEGADVRLAAARADLEPPVSSTVPAVGIPGTDAAAEPIAETVPLDAAIRRIDGADLDLPRRLLRKEARGTIVLVLGLTPEGGVEEVRVESSDLPDFEAFLTRKAREWRFTPPTRGGHPVAVEARLPISIRIQ